MARLVPAVDVGVAHAAGALLLVLPVDVHQLAELVQVADLQRLLALVAQLLHEVEVVGHLLVARAALGVLLLEDRAGRPGCSR
jgi:hypothetical protein